MIWRPKGGFAHPTTIILQAINPNFNFLHEKDVGQCVPISIKLSWFCKTGSMGCATSSMGCTTTFESLFGLGPAG
jgi:hypothetical protein